MSLREVGFDFEGKKIGGFLYIPNGKGPFPTVVFVHGFTGGTHEIKNKVMCEALAENGILVFIFDFYNNNGLSDIPIEETNVSLQLTILKKAVDFIATQKEVDAKRIGLTGHSLGGMTVMLYTPTDERIKVLVVQSGLSDFGQSKGTNVKYHAEWKKLGYREVEKSWGKIKIKWDYIEDGMKHNVYKALEKIKCPVLIFHGDEEESIPLEQAQEQIKHLKQIDKLVVIKGADHCYKINNTLPQATKLLVEFMKEKL